MKKILNGSGNFGQYGGCFAPELLQPILKKVENAFNEFKKNKEKQKEFKELLTHYAGRETPIYFAKNISKKIGGAQIWIKREDLLHGGAHKTNNVLGQMMLAKMMGMRKIIAETGAGQHGIATAMVGSMFGFEVKIFMGKKDIERQKPNVDRMKLLGADIVSIDSGSATLKDAVNEATRYWIANSHDTYYVFGTAAGPHPFPELVSYFQKVIGVEARKQVLKETGKLPKEVVAAVGGGSNAIGIFQGFLEDEKVKLIGVEPAGDGGKKHGMTLQKGKVGCLHGSLSKVMMDKDGQIEESYSISAGLDYPGVSPIHTFLQEIKRSEYVGITDKEAVNAFLRLSKDEGIIPALESSHALAQAFKNAKKYSKKDIILVNLSGRGDKDLDTVFKYIKNEKKK